MSPMALSDTSPTAERMQIELLRKATPAQRFARARSLSQSVIELSRRAMLRKVGDERQAVLMFVAASYGPELAEKLKVYLGDKP